MKKITILAALAVALSLSLTACKTDREEDSPNDSENSKPNSQQSQTNSPEQSNNSEPLPFTLFGADNVQINFGEVTSITDRKGEPLSPEKLEDTNWNEIVCDNFAYLAEHSDINFNSVDNADLYDPENAAFADVPSYSDIEYKRYYVGDKFGALTLTSAKTTFRRDGYEDKSGPYTSEQIKDEGLPFSGMLNRCDASFEGELTLSGYVRVCVDEYGVQAGEILFVPDKTCPLPVINFYTVRELDRTVTPLRTSLAHDFAYVSEYPEIRLGNISQYDNVYGIPTNGTTVRAHVTVDNITMFSDTALASVIQGEIVDIAVISEK